MAHTLDKVIGGSFEYKEGELSFTTINQNCSFEESRDALVKLKIEIERLLNNQSHCPYYKSSQ